MQKKLYKLVIYVPQTHLEQLRINICNAGAGIIGNYDNCTFMSPGIGTFRPKKGAKPKIGKINKLERIGEAKIETWVKKNKLKKVIAVIKKIHPYEEPVYEIYKLAG